MATKADILSELVNALTNMTLIVDATLRTAKIYDKGEIGSAGLQMLALLGTATEHVLTMLDETTTIDQILAHENQVYIRRQEIKAMYCQIVNSLPPEIREVTVKTPGEKNIASGRFQWGCIGSQQELRLNFYDG